MYGAYKLKSIICNDGLKEIGDSSFASTKIKNMSLPRTVEKICECAFMDCSNLRTINLNSGLKSIGPTAFDHTKISKVVIPDSVEKMDEFVFSNCKRLKKIYCVAESKPNGWSDEWDNKSFDNDKKHKVVWGYTGKTITK